MNLSDLSRKKSIPNLLAEMAKGEREGHTTGLFKTLSVWDLTAFGVAAVVGAGIFSTIGNAAFHGGPGVSFLFLFTAIACGFSAFCYAEFASILPVSGSAYTYAYASLGELVAWIIGWDLVMEYAVGNIAVAISWADYFKAFLSGYGIQIPSFLSMDWLTASRGYEAVTTALSSQTEWTVDMISKMDGVSIRKIFPDLSLLQIDGFFAYFSAPEILGTKLVCNIPAFMVTVLVTAIAYIGIRESKRIANVMVLFKIGVLLAVIAVGMAYVKPENFTPFFPHGISGVLKGVSGVFFAYIGFDAISTTAEECKNPQRDLPRAMIYSLVLCTVLYIAVALVLTGMVRSDLLNVGDPLAFVFGVEGANVPWISAAVAVSALVALFGVLLVFQVGQPRIWMAMSRDGLLPKKFSVIHPRFKTPSFSTLVTGVIVGIPALFMNLTEVTDLTSIGTLCAFLLVSLGVLFMDPHRERLPGKFRIPYINAQFVLPVISIFVLVGVKWFYPDSFNGLVNFREWEVWKHTIPLWGYLIGMVWLNFDCFQKKRSLIPALGVMTVGYLMTELGWTNWVRFGLWMVIGLGVYFLYSVKHSKLRSEA